MDLGPRLPDDARDLDHPEGRDVVSLRGERLARGRDECDVDGEAGGSGVGEEEVRPERGVLPDSGDGPGDGDAAELGTGDRGNGLPEETAEPRSRGLAVQDETHRVRGDADRAEAGRQAKDRPEDVGERDRRPRPDAVGLLGSVPAVDPVAEEFQRGPRGSRSGVRNDDVRRVERAAGSRGAGARRRPRGRTPARTPRGGCATKAAFRSRRGRHSSRPREAARRGGRGAGSGAPRSSRAVPERVAIRKEVDEYTGAVSGLWQTPATW